MQVSVVACCAAVLLLPGLVLSLGAGAVFGLQLGLLAVWLGATIGETIAFLLGRYVSTAHVRRLCVRCSIAERCACNKIEFREFNSAGFCFASLWPTSPTTMTGGRHWN